MAGQRRSSLIDVDRKGFLEDVQKELGKIKVGAKSDVMKLAIYAQNRMRELCAVDSGRLRASLTGDAVANSQGGDPVGPEGRVEGEDEGGYFIMLGTHVEYAVFIEFGTSRMRAQPFMRPAMAETAAHAGQVFAMQSIAGTPGSIGRAKPLFLKGDPGGTHGGRRVGPPA